MSPPSRHCAQYRRHRLRGGRITDRFATSVDVQGLATEALPPRAEFLAGGIATGVRTFVEDATKRILASKQFAEIWDQANRTAHEQVKKALTGEGKSIKLQNGKVVLDLSQVMIAVRTNLSEHGIGIFDKPIGKTAIQLELFDAKGLESARQAVHYLVIGRIVLIVLAIGLAAPGCSLSGDRRAGSPGGASASRSASTAAAITFAAPRPDHLPEGGIPARAAAGVRRDAALPTPRAARASRSGCSSPWRHPRRTQSRGRARRVRTSPRPHARAESGAVSPLRGGAQTALRITGVLVLLIAVLLATRRARSPSWSRRSSCSSGWRSSRSSVERRARRLFVMTFAFIC